MGYEPASAYRKEHRWWYEYLGERHTFWTKDYGSSAPGYRYAKSVTPIESSSGLNVDTLEPALDHCRSGQDAVGMPNLVWNVNSVRLANGDLQYILAGNDPA
jgi:hypothetical protein